MTPQGFPLTGSTEDGAQVLVIGWTQREIRAGASPNPPIAAAMPAQLAPVVVVLSAGKTITTGHPSPFVYTGPLRFDTD